MSRRLLKLGARASAASLVGCFGYGYAVVQTDEGANRAYRAYKTMVPVVIHYRLAELRHKYFSPMNEDDWEELDQRYAVSTVAKLAELQGMYCKYCQSAAGFTNTFGPAWIREFRKLESDVPPRPIDAVYKTIEEETGKPVNETFSTFDPVPLGSASIGQVHAATLLDGRVVAVKVQYPEARDLFENDMHTIRSLTENLAPEQLCLLDAIEKQNSAELDYRNEAQNLVEVSNNMIKHGFQPREVLVPKPIEGLSTPRMLVMDLLPGPKLIDGIYEYYSKMVAAQGKSLHDLEVELRDKVEKEGIPSQYNGPSAWRIGLYRRYLRVRDSLTNTAIATYNGTAGWVYPVLNYQRSILPPNVPQMVDTLMRAHGYQLLKDGVFNADPNGGNFTLLPDGRIGMIDYGATKRFTRNERLSACLIYAALARQDEKLLYDMCEVAGYKSKYRKPHVLYKLMQFGYDSWGKDVIGEKNIQQFVDDLKKEDPWEEVPENFTMLKVRYCGFLPDFSIFISSSLNSVHSCLEADEYSTASIDTGYASSNKVL